MAPDRDLDPGSHLLQGQNELDEAEDSGDVAPIITKNSPWNDYLRLGKFLASSMELGFRTNKVVVFKKTTIEEGLKEHQVLQTIKHRNVISVQAAFIHDSYLLLGLKYCRFTLEEMLLVPLKVEECHVQYIACSVS